MLQKTLWLLQHRACLLHTAILAMCKTLDAYNRPKRFLSGSAKAMRKLGSKHLKNYRREAGFALRIFVVYRPNS